MTEEEWLASDDLTAMLIHLRGDVEPPEREPDPRPRTLCGTAGDLVWGEAKRTTAGRLARFALEVCPLWRQLPLDADSLRHLTLFERYMTGTVTDEEFHADAADFWNLRPLDGSRFLSAMTFHWVPTPFGIGHLAQDVAWSTACYKQRERIEELERTATDDDRMAWGFFGYDFPEFHQTAEDVRRPLRSLLREVVGNPFRPVSCDPSWRTSTAIALAAAVCADRAFDRLPILADALEEAGCDHPDVLAHCRRPGPHARGCWVVDMVLGKV